MKRLGVIAQNVMFKDMFILEIKNVTVKEAKKKIIYKKS